MARLRALDVLKGVAILLVVFNHALLWPMRAGDLPSAFAYGLAFGTVAAFSAVAGYVQGLHPPQEEWSVVRKRARQLLVPWVIWAPVYAVAPLVWRTLGGGSLPFGFEPWPWARGILLGGGPLWFLPVLFISTAICAFLDLRTSRWWPAVASLALYVAVAVGFGLGNISPLDLGNGTFWPVAPLYVAAFWFGLRVSRDGVQAPPSLRGISRGALGAVIALSMASGGAATLIRAIHTDARWLMWIPYAVGVVGGCAALLLATRSAPEVGASFRIGVPITGALEKAGRLSLGVYVLHPALVGPAVIIAHGRGGVVAAAAVAVLAVVCGTAIVAGYHRLTSAKRRSAPA